VKHSGLKVIGLGYIDFSFELLLNFVNIPSTMIDNKNVWCYGYILRWTRFLYIL